MKRIERMTPHDDFLVSMMNDDPRLLDMFREAERNRKPGIHWPPLMGILIAFGVSTLAWVGIIEAVIHANRWFR